ncbi:hypothetical protein MMX123_02023 [Microbacterium sp. MM2322]
MSVGDADFTIGLNWPLLTDVLALRPSAAVELFC